MRLSWFFFFQAEDGIRDFCLSRGLGDVYKRQSLNPRRRETLEMITTDLYPEGGDISQATFWTGLRPATPDGTPIVGATRYRNLFLNTGHGTLGWTMACGSGRYLADLMAKKRPQISTEGLDISRYSNSPENAKNAHPAPAH